MPYWKKKKKINAGPLKKIKVAEGAFKATVQRKYLQSYIKRFPALENLNTQSGFYET